MTLALIGPTAIGKSELALALAEQLNGEIISVDSGAVYRDMNIGTAKPTAAEMKKIPHHLINIRNPNENYNVGCFDADARAAIAKIKNKNAVPILVGGTMLYARTLHRGIATIPPVPTHIAAAVKAELSEHGTAALYAQLQKSDNTTAAKINRNDKQRIHRALSVFRATGKPLSYWAAQPPSSPPPPICWVRLLPASRNTLRQRIGERLEQMWADGLLAETEHLITRWQLSADAPPLRLVGYRQATAHINGSITPDQMRAQAFHATCQLAKRQQTWLRQWHTAATHHPDTTPSPHLQTTLTTHYRTTFPMHH